MRYLLHFILFLLALPILLPIFNPSMKLGGFGLLLGFMAYTISPLVILSVIIAGIVKLLKSKN